MLAFFQRLTNSSILSFIWHVLYKIDVQPSYNCIQVYIYISLLLVKNKQEASCSSLFNAYTKYSFTIKLAAILAAIMDVLDRIMIQVNHVGFHLAQMYL